MAIDDFEVEGQTTFTERPGDSFRYRISLVNEQMNIWIEDRSSKKQWQSGFLSKEKYVTAANVFVDASVADYLLVRIASNSLWTAHWKKTEKSRRKLVSLQSNELQLELSIGLFLLRSCRIVKYDFTLDPIAVKHIDILESKLKDQEEELKKFRDRLSEVGRVSSISVLVPGLYTFEVLVNYALTQVDTDGSISLEMNGNQIQRASMRLGYNDLFRRGHGLNVQRNASLSCIVEVVKNSKIAVVCTGSPLLRTHVHI